MISRKHRARLITVLLLSAALLIIASIAPVFLETSSIGLLAWAPFSIVFGGVNVAAAYAAIGLGTNLRRQLSMAVLTCLVWSAVAIGSVVAFDHSRDSKLLSVGLCTMCFFLLAQIPFWMLRRSCGLRLTDIDETKLRAFKARFKLLDVLLVMLMVAIAATILRWAISSSLHNPSLRLPIFTCILLFVCLALTAPTTTRIAFYDRIFDVVRYVCCTYVAAWGLALAVLYTVRSAAVQAIPSLEYVVRVGFITAILLMTILGTFRVLRATGMRIAGS